ncbi:hypothetical protein C7999DRAFT_15092 [Corynascus novoguineensis]|uniref:Uncharacterized protein n=1 Tax=Corynascus novoguineensis TaxID=1126955 RepID=A0AAN7CR59_9PEZI|nr:hypothetical protein C7999DRAFT_15092 [Corynascus novoguineensis]
MATLAVDGEEDGIEPCIVVANRKLKPPRFSNLPTSTASMEHGAQSQAPTKRRRGRPRKAKNNTADTAIVLSDSEPGGSSPKKLDKKRPSDHPEILSPAQSSKRPATSPSMSINALLSTRAEIDQINQQLASERELRAGAEKKQAELQALLNQKNASWVADLAAQMTPLQLELQKLAKERNDIADKYDEVLLHNANLQGILGKSQESDANANKLGPAASEKTSCQVTNKDLVEIKECLVRAERQLLDKDAKIIELRHNINVKEKTVSTLDKKLTESNKKWTDAENKCKKAADELTALGTIRREVEEKLNIVQQTLAMTESSRRECEAKTEQQLAIMAKKQKETEVQLKAKEEHLEETEEMLRQSKEIINGLKRENTAMVEQIQAQLEEMRTLQQKVTALEQEKQQLTQAVADKGSFLHRERVNWAAKNGAMSHRLPGQESLVSTLEREWQEWGTSSACAGGNASHITKQSIEQTDPLGAMQAKQRPWTAGLDRGSQQVTDLKREADYYRQTAANSREELKYLAQQYAQAHHDAARVEAGLRDTIGQLSNNLAAEDGELRRLRQDIAKEALEQNALDEQVRIMNARLVKVQKELREKHDLVAAQQLEAGQLHDTINTLRTSVSKLQVELRSQKQELQQSRAELTIKENDIATKQVHIEKLDDTISTLKIEKSSLENDLMNQKQKLQQLDNQLTLHTSTGNGKLKATGANDNEETITSLRQQLFKVNQEKDKLRQQITADVSEINRLKSQLADATDTVNRLTHADVMRETTTSALEASIHALTTNQKKANNLISTLEAEITHLQSQLTSSTSQTTGLQERIAHLAEANAELNKDHEQRAIEVECLKIKLTELMAESEMLEECLAKRDGCLQRMHEFLRTMPQWMETAFKK